VVKKVTDCTDLRDLDLHRIFEIGVLDEGLYVTQQALDAVPAGNAAL
jgi:hypothetical protein